MAKRHDLQNPKEAHDWQTAEKARTLYKKGDAAALAALIAQKAALRLKLEGDDGFLTTLPQVLQHIDFRTEQLLTPSKLQG